MELKLIGESLGKDLSTLVSYEGYYREGDKGELRLYVESLLTRETIEQLEAEIINQGVTLTESIKQDARVVVIRFQKRIAPLLIIGGVLVAIVGGILGWQIFMSVQLGVPIWVWLVGGLSLVYLLFREPVKEIGKVYITKKMIR